MLDKVRQVVDRFEQVEYQMMDPAVMADHVKLTKLSQERSELEPLVSAFKAHANAQQELADTQEMLSAETDRDMIEMAQEEIKSLSAEIEALEAKMLKLMIPKDPRDNKNVYIEIRAGAGGDEAGIFASDLLRMYTKYAESNKMRVDLMDENRTGVGGYKEVTIAVKGKGAFSKFKYEMGVHRVQRVPADRVTGAHSYQHSHRRCDARNRPR